MDNSKQKVIKIVTVSAIALIILLAASLVINLVKLGNSLGRESKLKSEIEVMDSKIEQNEGTIEELKSFDYIEQYARDHFNMKGRDEQAFVPRAE